MSDKKIGTELAAESPRIGALLTAESKRIGDELREARLKSIQKMVLSRLAKVLEALKTTSATKVSQSIAFKIEELGLVRTELEATRDNSAASVLWKQLQDWSTEQGLSVAQEWVHPDCSYCEECGSGCKVTHLVWSWS